jgi:intein/homing endonuclease
MNPDDLKRLLLAMGAREPGLKVPIRSLLDYMEENGTSVVTGSREGALASKVSSRYLRATYLPNLSDGFQKKLIEGIKSYILQALSPFPSKDPQRAETKLAQMVREELDDDASLSNRDAHEFIRSLIGYLKIGLPTGSVESAASEVLDGVDTGGVAEGRLTALLSDMVGGIQRDPSRGALKAQDKAVRLLERALVVKEYEALQILDALLDHLQLDIAVRSDQMNGLLASYLSQDSRAASMARRAKDIPKTVERYVKEHKDKGMDEDKAWAIAWSRYCVAGNTLVPTQNGLKSVEELYNEAAGQKVMHSDGVEAKPTRVRLASRYGEAASSHIIYTGTKSTVSVNTKHGYSLTCTPDHQILVLNENDYSTEWVEAQEALGRYAVLPTHGVWGARTTLPEIGYETNTWNNVIPFRQPRELSPALARLLGYLVAEGSVTEEGVEFSNTDPRLIRDFVRCSKEVFGQEPIVEWRDRSEEGWKDCGKVRLRTRWYREFFEALGLPPGTAHDKQVPSIIMEAPREMVREFLVGFVEGDGYTGDSDHLNRVDLSTSSEPLARQLHLLLLNFGIPASLECNARGYFNVRVHSKPMVVKYRDQIGTAFKKVAVSGDRQRQRGSEFEMIPAESLLKLGSKVRSAFPGTKRVSLSRLLRKWDALESCRGTEGVVDNIRELMNHGYYFDRVTQVEAQGETDVYDVSVPEDVSFVANGMIAHNCKYKKPGSPRCKKDNYFEGRDSSINKQAAITTSLESIPQRGAEVVGVELSTHGGVTVRFNDGSHMFSHSNYDSKLPDSDYSKEKAVERLEFLLNTSRDVLHRSDMLEILPHAFEAGDGINSTQLREWFYPHLERMVKEHEAYMAEITDSTGFKTLASKVATTYLNDEDL